MAEGGGPLPPRSSTKRSDSFLYNKGPTNPDRAMKSFAISASDLEACVKELPNTWDGWAHASQDQANGRIFQEEAWLEQAHVYGGYMRFQRSFWTFLAFAEPENLRLLRIRPIGMQRDARRAGQAAYYQMKQASKSSRGNPPLSDHLLVQYFD